MNISRSGLTVVELVFVSAMLAVSAGVLLPVLQNTREEARRAQCADQIGQLMLASLMYEEANGTVPPLQTSRGPGPGSSGIANSSAPHQNTGALAYILPFINQSRLFELLPMVATEADTLLGPDTEPLVDFLSFFSDDGVRAAISLKTKQFICPSNASYSNAAVQFLYFSVIQNTSSNQQQIFTFFNSDTPTAFGRTSYLPTVGGFAVGRESQSRGINISLEDSAGPFRNRTDSISVQELGDGASNTIGWGESLGWIRPGIGLEGANLALLHTGLLTGDTWLIGGDPVLFGNAEASIPWMIGSMHQGGNNVAMCDGSVRFLNSKTNRGLSAQLGCGNDGWGARR